MPTAIEIGTIVLEDRPAIVQALKLESEPFCDGWGLLKSVGATALESKVSAAGWRCFFLAGEVKATVFGSRAIENSRRALRRILTNVQEQNFNCLEITRIVDKRFLGIPYTTVAGHSRHIQPGWLLQDSEGRRNSQTDADWALS